jgi:protein-disulfide isomerase
MRASLAWLRRVRRLTVGIRVAGFVLLATVCLEVTRVHLSGLQRTTQARVRGDGPWVFGRPDARFTVIEYADLECPYCRAYFPVLKSWIEEHPQVNWEWWNLPLEIHDPVASREAVLAECTGEVDGNQAFWRTVAWIYRHTRGDGAGIPSGTRMPEKSRAIRACLDTRKAAQVIRAQAADASLLHIMGTPTLRILDHTTGRALELQGPVAGDSLLSAIDSLAATGSHQ